MSFKDHFSGHAADYAQARPRYPQALFAWLAAQCPRRELAWDAGCGNGQAAVALAPLFERVVATDPSAGQVAQAQAHPVVEYRVEPAEQPSLDDASVDLVVVAQAFHWFDHPRFHQAVNRVARPGALVALWSYGLSAVTPEVDRVYRSLYDGLLGAYWTPERRDVENGYADLPFPYAPVEVPAFEMALDWTLPQYLAYLRTWSASQRYLRETGHDAVAQVADEMANAWGEPQRARTVRWPLAMRVGRIG